MGVGADQPCLAGTGIEPMRPDITHALQQPTPEGLAVPL